MLDCFCVTFCCSLIAVNPNQSPATVREEANLAVFVTSWGLLKCCADPWQRAWLAAESSNRPKCERHLGVHARERGWG